MKENRILMETIFHEGTIDGIMQVTSPNFNGICYRLPRNKISNCDSIKQFIDSPAVYILIGKENEKPVYYIGEANDCLTRIKQHVKEEEDYWNTALLFVGTTNHPLDKTLVKALEAELCKLAFEKQKNNYFDLKNGNCPKGVHINDAQSIKVNIFFEGIITLCNALGLNLFEEDTKEIISESDSKLFICEVKKKNIKATGYRVDKGFLVLNGSQCTIDMDDGTTPCFINERLKLVEEGVIVNGVFEKDYVFSSSSAAATQVCGHNMSGLQNWKTEDGVTLKEIQELEAK